jgi:N-acetylglucosamine kinase-like BadF-type ATPase
LFTGATVFTESDLLASARATLAGEKGIACILGTGSNSCYYDGEKIQSHVPPLGFILGDEGSGAVIGRKLVGDYLKNLMPGNLKKVFGEKYPLTYADFLNHVYRLEKPNKFLAEFVPFLSGNIENDYCSTLIKTAFSEFIVRNVAQYERHTELPISFTGSVAYHFRTQLLETLEQFNLKCVAIVADPMEGLIHFHKKNG